MKLTMWRVVVVLNMHTKFRQNSVLHLSYIVCRNNEGGYVD